MYPDMQSSSASWMFFVKASFFISITAMIVGIIFLPADITVKAYLAICALFVVNSTITLSKTMRDEHESQRLVNKISEAKTQQILKEFTQ